MTSLARVRDRRRLPVLFVTAWLAYALTPCAGMPTAHRHCRAKTVETAAVSHAHEGCSGATADRTAALKSQGPAPDDGPPVDTCCLSGECVTGLPVPAPSFTVSLIVATPMVIPVAISPREHGLHAPELDQAHGPPTYLRNVTLRI
jgi:hypothetical protein